MSVDPNEPFGKGRFEGAQRGGLTTHEMRLLRRAIHPLIDGVSLWGHKSTNETICGSDTLQDDDDLYFMAPPGPNEFAVHMHLSMLSQAAADLKLSIDAPACYTWEFSVEDTRVGAAQTVHWDCSGDLVVTTANCTIETIEVQGIIIQPAGAPAGKVSVFWSANVAGQGATVMRKGSWMQVTRMHGNVHEFPGQYRDE